jgi:cytidyltransferase-like protein
MNRVKGMVFGVFDGLHEGHAHFLREAASRCDELVAVVATDEAARALKGRAPKFSLSERIARVVALGASTVAPGDEEQGAWRVLEKHAPDVVFLGYDQDAIAKALDARGIRYEYVSAHEPGRFKSSLLNGETSPSA